jgi:hypothetical protein
MTLSSLFLRLFILGSVLGSNLCSSANRVRGTPTAFPFRAGLTRRSPGPTLGFQVRRSSIQLSSLRAAEAARKKNNIRTFGQPRRQAPRRDLLDRIGTGHHFNLDTQYSAPSWYLASELALHDHCPSHQRGTRCGGRWIAAKLRDGWGAAALAGVSTSRIEFVNGGGPPSAASRHLPPQRSALVGRAMSGERVARLDELSPRKTAVSPTPVMVCAGWVVRFSFLPQNSLIVVMVREGGPPTTSQHLGNGKGSRGWFAYANHDSNLEIEELRPVTIIMR